MSARPAYECGELIFFFFLSSNFWIIFLSIISTWINEWFAGIYLIEENKVTFVTLQNYEIKFKSAHITALHHHQELSFQRSAASGNPEGQHTVKSGCWTLRTAPAHCCWAPLFQMRPPFLSDAQSGQDHVAQGDTECIYTGSAAASTVGMLNARKLWIAVSTLLSNWASTVTPWWGGSLFKLFPAPPLIELPDRLWLLPDCGTLTSLT